MFMHHGFRPILYGHHQVVPTLSSPAGGIFDLAWTNRSVEWLFKFNSVLETLWPIKKFSTNVFIVGQKVQAFHG
jgi:hypothetical protein